jgi:hypothetical protein
MTTDKLSAAAAEAALKESLALAAAHKAIDLLPQD